MYNSELDSMNKLSVPKVERPSCDDILRELRECNLSTNHSVSRLRKVVEKVIGFTPIVADTSVNSSDQKEPCISDKLRQLSSFHSSNNADFNELLFALEVYFETNNEISARN